MPHSLSFPAMRFIAVILCSLTLLNVAPSYRFNSVAAYTVQNVSASAPLRWATSTITVQLSASLSQPPGTFKSGSDARGAVLRALDRWRAAARVEFIVIDSPAASASTNFATRDGITLITVADTSTNRSFFPGDNPGLAKLFFNPVTGIITEADVVLNPYVHFSTDGTSFDSNNPHGTQTYDAEEIFTHEIGHLLGLGHSGSIGSTMRPLTIYNNAYGAASVAGRTLSVDDVLAAQSLYGARTNEGRGTISGVINLASGGNAAGAHVIAENVTNGNVAGANVTSQDGSYRIEGLAPGKYRLQVENLDQPVLPVDISYVGLTGASPSFRVVEMQAGKVRRVFGASGRAKPLSGGSIAVTSGSVTQVNLTVDVSQAASINPIGLGAGGAIGSAAVPFLPGQSRTVLVEGAGLDAVVPTSGGSVSINSPFVSVIPSSVRRIGLTPQNNLPYIAFTVSVRADAPSGDYTLRFRTASGEVALMAGGISVEASATNIVSNYEPESSLAFVSALGKSTFRNIERFRTKQEAPNVVVFGNRAAADDLDLHF